jgi:4-amino-4-deoxy-L-arabinose transferase-like glycosyltransferase
MQREILRHMANTSSSTLHGPRARAAWLSPAERPAYETLMLLGITVMAAVLFAWDIQHSPYHAFYAETARSMTESWKGFLFGSFDPGNSITIDKLPGFLWPQALSARVFGFHPWALTIPQVIEGVLSVLVLHRLIRRWAGANAALLSAAAFTLTPAVAGLFRTAVEDPAFTLLLLLAAEATQRAARTARPRTLVAAGVWVGLAFQTKMLEAWAVLPALGLVYALSAPASWRRRLGHLALAGAVTVAVSTSWILLVTLTPAKDRPYVDGTTNNSAVSMVVGYNFLNRFSLGISPKDTGSVGGQSPVVSGHTQPAAVSAAHGQPVRSWAKMFGKSLGTQTGWLYWQAALAAVCGVVWRRGRPRTDPQRAGYLLWGVWLATFMFLFSAGAVGRHTYYMGVVAVPLAALFGAGTMLFWRAYRTGRGRRVWALPATITATVAWSAFLARTFPSFLPWLAPTTTVLGLAALTLLTTARRRAHADRTVRAAEVNGVNSVNAGKDAGRADRAGVGGRAGRTDRLAVLGLGLGVVAMLLPSAAWASSVLDARYGHSGFGSAGPVAGHTGSVTRLSAAARPDLTPYAGDPESGKGKSSTAGRSLDSTKLTADQRRLLSYVLARRDGARYVLATMNWRAASPYILDAGAPVLPMGGFTGQAPSPTLAGFQRLVHTGQVRYALLGSSKVTSPTIAWVTTTCTPVWFGELRLYHCR